MMTDKFNGFSQDEINKLSGNKVNKKAIVDAATNVPNKHKGIRRMPDRTSKIAAAPSTVQINKQQGGNKATDSARNTLATENKGDKPHDNEDDDTLSLNNSMSKSLEDALFAPLKTQKTEGTTGKTEAVDNSSILTTKTLPRSSNNNSSNDDSSILSSVNNDCENHEVVTDSPFKGISLKDFENHRKMIEEQNKQKKDLLYKAIEKHTQKTAAEARKLEEIRKELSKLETDLAVDVALLRKQIDSACIHFSNVE